MATVIDGIQYVTALNGTLIPFADCTVDICSLQYAELDYIPTLAGNLVYLFAFVIGLAAQIILLILHRTWGFSTGIICGLLLEIAGYAGRVALHDDDFNFNDFVLYLVCLTIAPAFISASIYLCLSRLVVVYGQNIARFSPKAYTAIFICCDFLSLLLQGAGGGITATAKNGSSTQNAGVNIMIAGLAFQVVSLTVFIVLGLDFVVAARRARTQDLNASFTSLRATKAFRALPWGLAIATTTIFIRSCFRVAELKDGFSSSLANNQTMFMIFEGPMIMIAILALTLLHPGISFGGRRTWNDANWSWKSKAPKGEVELQKS